MANKGTIAISGKDIADFATVVSALAAVLENEGRALFEVESAWLNNEDNVEWGDQAELIQKTCNSINGSYAEIISAASKAASAANDLAAKYGVVADKSISTMEETLSLINKVKAGIQDIKASK